MTRTQLARVASCSPSWVTRVLNGSVHLTPDQALAIAEHMGLSDDETEYFMLLLDLERCGTPALRSRIQRKLEKIRTESLALHSAIKRRNTPQITTENARTYYSSWMFAALHVACMIRPSTSAELSATLLIPQRTTSQGLAQLRAMGLVTLKNSKWTATNANIHLPSNDIAANFVHRDWRIRTAQHLDEMSPNDLHYSAAHCLSRADLLKIHRLLKEAILESRKMIENSPSETLAVFCLDWYELA